MKVIVTGAGGQLGRALIAQCPEGWECVAAGRDICDLADPGAVAAMVEQERPDVVVNSGAYTAVDKAESEEKLATAINAGAPRAFAEALDKVGGQLVQVSTDFVFDGQSSRAYRPDDRPNPLSAYGRSKLAGEQAAGSDAIVLRTSWVYGAGGANFVRTMLRLMAEREELGVVADQIGTPTWAFDLARTIWELAVIGTPGIYHHRDAGVASWYDFAVAIAEEARCIGLLDKAARIKSIGTADYPTPAARPAFSLLDDRATRALLGDETSHWRVNLRKMLEEENSLA